MLATVGAHRLDYTIRGVGSPTIVIEPAFGGTAASWEAVAERLAVETTVLTYDRAAYGRSSAARDNRTASDVARDLDGLLDVLDVPRPIVLVGHSLGGVFVRAYTAAHDADVAGMVLVDSSHEAQDAAMRPYRRRRDRIRESVGISIAMLGTRYFRNGADRRSILRERKSFASMASDAGLAAGTLGHRPLIVLTRAPTDSDAPGSWSVWHDLHRDLATISDNARHVVANEAGHYIHEADPDLVCSAISAVITSVRSGAPLEFTESAQPTRTRPEPAKPQAEVPRRIRTSIPKLDR